MRGLAVGIDGENCWDARMSVAAMATLRALMLPAKGIDQPFEVAETDDGSWISKKVIVQF